MIVYLYSLYVNRRQYVISPLLTGEVNSTLFAFLEIVRRFIWNFFRLENEHLNNCGEFRAVRDIYLAPLSDDLQVLEDMMDMENVATDDINRKIKIA